MKKENHLFMGAKNTRTKQLENPRYASKANNYSCPRCESDVKLRQGEVYVHHFAHKNENKVGGCKYYKKGGATESEKHKLGKQIFKTLIDNKKPMIFFRKCDQCEKNKVFCINKENYNDNTRAIMEHRFNYNNSNKSADVAMLEGDNIKFIFEVHYKNKTKEENRPNDIVWFEVEAEDLIVIVHQTEQTEQYEFNCMRNMKCSDCDMKNKIREQSDKQARAADEVEEKIRIRNQEARRKEEEARRKEEEARRKEEEARRKEEEARRKKEEQAMREGEDEITRLRRKWGNGCKPLISIF